MENFARPLARGLAEPVGFLTRMSSQGFTYYVDSINGSDANDGSSAAQAFRTLAAIPALTNGQSIAFARGSVFENQQLLIEADNVRLAAYGEGDKPIFRGSKAISAEDWTKTGGQTNVYETAITFDADPSGWVQFFEDSAPLTRRTSVANVDSNAGSYYVSSDTSGSATLYVHPKASTNPTSDGKAYRHSSKAAVLFAYSADSLTLENLVFQHSVYKQGIVTLGKSARVTGCEFRDGSRHNFISRGGSLYVNDCVFADGSFDGTGATLFVSYEDTATHDDTITMLNCAFSSLNSVDTNVTGFLNHDAGAGEFGPVVLSGCTFDDIPQGASLTNALSYAVSSCTLDTISTGIAVSETNAVTITNCPMTNVAQYGISMTTDGNVTVVDCDITIDGTVFAQCVYSNASSGATLTVTGGTLTSETPTYDGARGIRTLNGGTNVTVSGVRFALRRPFYMTDAGSTLVSSDNNSYSTAAVLWTHKNTSYTGLANWKAAGFDANSTQDT